MAACHRGDAPILTVLIAGRIKRANVSEHVNFLEPVLRSVVDNYFNRCDFFF